MMAFVTAHAQEVSTQLNLVPAPESLTQGKGRFTISANTVIVNTAGNIFEKETTLLSELFGNFFDGPLPIGARPKSSSIQLNYDPSLSHPEEYRLRISPVGALLSAKTPAGIFRGIQTIRQLLPASVENKQVLSKKEVVLPALYIKDKPLYSWRGMHLDVSRHFFSINYLHKLIDLMALYKFNKFHLHLTDDQGWRIEIKKYPKLTEEGAWRTFNNQDSSCMEKAATNPDFIIDPQHIVQKNGKTLYGGFYTQQQMKELVAYAASKHIEVIPEIDMPGHMMAAINSYKYLSCDGTSSFGELFSIPICPCLPTTMEFAQDVYKEIMDIFPSKYIHIGGDEVDRSYWEKSPACKSLMAKEGFKTTAELQSYFIREMEKFFNRHGRTLIGWDEILEGGISKTATIMYWRLWVPKAPVEAVKNGNRVIMASLNPLYFSHPPDKNSLADVYKFNPVPVALTNTEAKSILGAQGNLWTEQVPSENRADYLLLPRMLALSEVLWTKQRDFTSFLLRLQGQYARLDQLRVNYRLPDLPLLEKYSFIDTTTLTVKVPMNDLAIRYTTDSTLPTMQSKLLTGPLAISKPQYIRLAAFRANGHRGDVYDVEYKKETLADATAITGLTSGLMCSWYKGSFKGATFIPSGEPDGKITVANIVVPKVAESPSFALRFRGYINVPDDGIYSFFLTSDDAAILRIADREVVNNDGMHAPKEKNGQVALKKGLHPIELDFVEGGGGYTLKLQYSRNGTGPKDIPSTWFKNKF